MQLHIADVVIDHEYPHLLITEESADPSTGKDAKHVKSDAGVREVPLHPDLIELGFADFVRNRNKSKGNGKRLFREIRYGADGQPSTIASKWFGRLLDSVGLSDPTLVFHSFRHGMEDALRNAEKPQYVIDRILGHTGQASEGDGYGAGTALAINTKAMIAAKLPVSVAGLLGEAGHE
ncbi:MAG: hypothetical protein ABMA01_19020 [Chthoniobacteraceae bacterium]